MANSLFPGLSLSPSFSTYACLTICELWITKTNHLNCCSTGRKMTTHFGFTGSYKKQLFFQQNCPYFMCHFHVLALFPFCNLVSRGETYTFHVHAARSFYPPKLRLAGRKLGLLGIHTRAAKSAPGSIGSSEIVLT